MRVFGNLSNRIMESSKQPKPEIGLGCTILLFSDRQAATIINVNKKLNRIMIQLDTPTRTDSNGMSESQTYTFSPNPNGEKSIFTLRKNGAWVKLGQAMKNGSRIAIGVRSEYHDYGF